MVNPGGTLHLALSFDDKRAEAHANLTGETTLVASGTLSDEWLGHTLA